MRNIKTALVVASLFTLVSCGGGGSSTDGGIVATPLAPDPAPAPAPAAPTPAPDPAPAAPTPTPDPAPVPAPQAVGTVTTNFESGPVRTMALSPDGSRLFVTNIADQSLEIFDITESGLVAAGAVPVGLEPVAVAARSNTEVWVVNHLSDSISIVDLTGIPRVVRTLLVGDEPRDIVFAGDRGLAFITAAYRGQNHPTFDINDLRTPGLGRADVWVFDPANLGADGDPLTIVNMFADSPRALAVSPDGSRVYAAAFFSGNQTTAIPNRPDVANGKALPIESVEGALQPATGLIVQFQQSDGTWRDDAGTDWSALVSFDLPDNDVFVIDANATTPTLLTNHTGVGTTLFNMAVNPQSGVIYVSNTEARNRVRFEGPGNQPNATTVRGSAVLNQITVIDGNQVTQQHLNPHVDFSIAEGESLPPGDRERSLAQPQDMVVSADGQTLYLAAFGSNKIARFATSELEDGSFVPNVNDQLVLPGGAPGGLVLSQDGTRLYAFTRLNNGVSVIDTASFSVVQSLTMFSPEAEQIIEGRRLLYDADLTSANGTLSCGSCHVFGDFDGLAWDLGNPDGLLEENENEFVQFRFRTFENFHPMKGPMTTQTFRGIADSGPMHWRGDRQGLAPEVVDGELESLEAAAFKEFNPAFVELLGREEEVDDEMMQAFTDFSLNIIPPPNPIRNLDNSLTADQAEGRRVYFEDPTTGGVLECNHCHVLDPAENHFGTDGLMTNEGPQVTEDFKVPHLRNVYAKIGMFGQPEGPDMGNQIRGFGLLHDGAIDTTSNFLSSSVFGFDSDAQREQVVDFMFAFDANLAPIVGQQITLRGNDSAAVLARRDLLVDRALNSSPVECDLVAQGIVDGQARSALLQANGSFITDNSDDPAVPQNTLFAFAEPGQELTLTCVPPGMGQRLALDRDLDGVFNANEQ